MTTKNLSLWFALVLLLALYSRWHTDRTRDQRCALDGNRIQTWARVDLMAGDKVLKSFCCVTCAGQWPDVPENAYWQVHDEITGKPLDATRAWFVRSAKVTVAARACRIHVFREWPDSVAHARQYDGRIIPNPLGQTRD
jgi:hypothetical protein